MMEKIPSQKIAIFIVILLFYVVRNIDSGESNATR